LQIASWISKRYILKLLYKPLGKEPLVSLNVNTYSRGQKKVGQVLLRNLAKI
jgi:hypothetical protein